MTKNYNLYKPIRNKIRRYDTQQLFQKIIKTLHSISTMTQKEAARKGIPPWELLLLIKWTLLESKNTKKIKAELTDHNFIAIIKEFSEIDSHKSFYKENNFLKIPRQLIFTQSWLYLSKKELTIRISIVIELFMQNSLPQLNEILIQNIGLTKKEFFDLALFTLLLMTHYEDNQPFLTEKNYEIILGFEPDKVKKFLKTISIDGAEAFNIAEANSTYDPVLQLNERTPFKRHPFIQTDKGVYCLYPPLFSYYIENFLYDYSTSISKGKFNDNFGAVFENYVYKKLIIIDQNILREKSTRQRFNIQKTKKIVDFVLEAPNDNLLIEAKAIQLSHIAQVDPSNKKMSSHLKNSIIKGLAQAIETIQSTHSNNKNNYIFIITYKELNTIASLAWNEFLKNELNKNYSGLDISIIDPKKIFFISIYELNILTALYENNMSDLFQQLKIISDLKYPKQFFLENFPIVYKKNDLKKLKDPFFEEFRQLQYRLLR